VRWILASFLIAALSALAQTPDYLAALPAFKEVINREIAAGNISGVSVGLVEGNRILYVDGFGFADKKKRLPATRDTVYRAGSISKLFTALATMQLVERGKLSIDQPVTELWPDFRIVNPFPDAKPITLRQLMAHRAGMFRECPVGSYFDSSEPGLRATVRSIEPCVLVYPPETKTKYSNIGVTVVGQTVGTVAGLPFQDYAREMLFRPLEMKHSSFMRTKAVGYQLATGYMLVANARSGFHEIEAPRFELGTLPAGNLYATAEDLAIFLRVLLAGGRSGGTQIVRPETLAEMWTAQLTQESNGFGIGFLVGHGKNGKKTIGHSGAVFGFTSSLAAIPEDRLGVIVLANDDLASAAVERINNAAWRMLRDQKEEVKASVPPSLDISGEYESESYWAKINGLTANFSGEKTTLRPAGELTFEINNRIINNGTLTVAADHQSFTALGQKFEHARKRPAIPRAWKDLLGSYGPEFIPLIISERNGRLYAMTENMYDYALSPESDTVFKMPPGLYTDEHLVFHRNEKGKIHLAVLANMPLPRRK
jgi:CubicO group peptidase (beta-lactamase class C family)